MSVHDVSEQFSTVLGAQKDSICVRRHTTPYKPHLILKSIEELPWSDEEDEDSVLEDDINARPKKTYYTFFAAKNINVKPGKEILFAIRGHGSEDEALVFEVVSRDADSIKEADSHKKGSNDNNRSQTMLKEPQVEEYFHPKMRKGWTRTVNVPETPAPSLPAAVKVYSDAAVQVTPSFTHASAQTAIPSLPTQSSTEVQTDADLSAVASYDKSQEHDVLTAGRTTPQGHPTLQISTVVECVAMEVSRDSTPMELDTPIDTPPFHETTHSFVSSTLVGSEAASSPTVGPPASPDMEVESTPLARMKTWAELPQQPNTGLPVMRSHSEGSSLTSHVLTPASSVPPTREPSRSPAVFLPTALRPLAPASKSSSSLVGASHASASFLPSKPAWTPISAKLPPSISHISSTQIILNNTQSPIIASRSMITPASLPGIKPEKRVLRPPPVFVPASKPKLEGTIPASPVHPLPEIAPITVIENPSSEPYPLHDPLGGTTSDSPTIALPDLCWLITCPWRHGLLVQVRGSHPIGELKGCHSGLYEGKRAVVTFFNFFGSQPSSDTMARVFLVEGRKELYFPIRYLIPVPPSKPEEYAITISGPSAGAVVKVLDAPKRGQRSIVQRFTQAQSVVRAEALCTLEWGNGPPDSYLRDAAPQSPLIPSQYEGRARPPIHGFSDTIITPLVPTQVALPTVSLGHPASLPAPPRKPAVHLPRPPDVQSTVRNPSIVKIEHVSPPRSLFSLPLPPAPNWAERGDHVQWSGYPSAPGKFGYPRGVPPEIVATPGWNPPPNASLPPRPHARQNQNQHQHQHQHQTQNDGAMSNRKRKRMNNGRNRGLPPQGDSYRPNPNSRPDPDYETGSGTFRSDTYNQMDGQSRVHGGYDGYDLGNFGPRDDGGHGGYGGENNYRPNYGEGYYLGGENNYRPDHKADEAILPPVHGDSYRPTYNGQYDGVRRDSPAGGERRRPGYDQYVPEDPHEPGRSQARTTTRSGSASRSRSRSRSRTRSSRQEDDIASSREASPAPARDRKRTRTPADPMTALEDDTSRSNSNSNGARLSEHVCDVNVDRYSWPTLKPLHSVLMKTSTGSEVGIRSVSFNAGGSLIAASCDDCTVRVYASDGRAEVATLKHEWPVACMAWMDGNAGLMTIGTNGIVSKWTSLTSQTPARWFCAKMLDAKTQDPIAFAFVSNRAAVVHADEGVKLWEWSRGTWQELRGIKRSGVTVITFIHDGTALLGGTTDGVIFYSEVPNGTMRATTFLKQKITAIDMDPSGTRALVSLLNGHAHIISVPAKGKLGQEEQVFHMEKTPSGLSMRFPMPAVFTGNNGDGVMLGSADGCLLIWNPQTMALLAGLPTDDAEAVNVAASQPDSPNKSGCLVTASRGRLTWWPQTGHPS